MNKAIHWRDLLVLNVINYVTGTVQLAASV